MILTNEYIKNAENVIAMNFKRRTAALNQNKTKELMNFCLGSKKILDVGCGAFMPHILKASHACDVSNVAEKYLRSLGWKGKFKTCSCDFLLYKDKEFDCVVCSEVIEHLPDEEIVIKTFKELERVGKKFIITTPYCEKSGVREKWNVEKDHRLFFSVSDINRLAKPIKLGVKIVEDGIVKHIVATRS